MVVEEVDEGNEGAEAEATAPARSQGFGGEPIVAEKMRLMRGSALDEADERQSSTRDLCEQLSSQPLSPNSDVHLKFREFVDHRL